MELVRRVFIKDKEIILVGTAHISSESAELVKNNEDQFNVIVKVQNKGYNSDTFRTVITIDNKLDNIYETYYVVGHYEFKNWEISVGKDGKKPEKW